MSHFAQNLRRLGNLFHLAADQIEKEPAAKYPDDPTHPAQEILRATVVLLHAVLEDTLREIIHPKLSQSPKETLDDIPLIGISPTGRPKKFSLGDLNKHREKTVNELIQESINEFLNHQSFSSCNAIVNILNTLKVDISHVEGYFVSLDEMISRRHQIVHRADRENDPESQNLAPIDPPDVIKWTKAVVSFIKDLFLEMYVSEADPNQQKQLRSYLQQTFFAQLRL